MKRFIAVSLFVALLCSLAMAQKPDWVRSGGASSRYSDQLYLIGFGMCKVNQEFDKAKAQGRAIEVARGYLAQRIRVRIQSKVGSTVTEQNSHITSYFTNATQSISTLEIQGVDIQTFYDDGEEMSYALAAVSRESLEKIYYEKERALKKEIRQHLAAGKQIEESGSRTKALDEYLACYPLFRELEEAQAILLVSRTTTRDTKEDLQDQVAKEEVALSEVRDAVERLLQKPVSSIEDLGWNLAYCLKEQGDIKNASVLVAPFAFQDTKMGSPFARYFKQVLEGKLIEVAKWSPVQQAESGKPRGLNISRDLAEASGAQYVLKGSYWKQQGKVKVIALLQKSADSKIVGSAETMVNEQLLSQNGLSLEPQNFKAALADQKQFAADEIVGGGLMLEVWTNKGAEDLVFAQGDSMTVFVRVNAPSHIRFLYHLANGMRVVLEKDHFIDESKVNMVYTSPNWIFTCDAPFGVEQMQVFAMSEPFEPLETDKWGDYDVLKEDVLGKFLATQRGMKMVKQGTMRAETRLVVTTMEK